MRPRATISPLTHHWCVTDTGSSSASDVVDTAVRVSFVRTGEGESVTIPAHDGLMGILVGHAPMMALLGTGDVVVKEGSSEHRIHVSGGFMQVIDDEVSVLAESVDAGDAAEASD